MPNCLREAGVGNATNVYQRANRKFKGANINKSINLALVYPSSDKPAK